MNILIADDHETNRKLLSAILSAEGYTVREAHDGGGALDILQAATEPLVALIDWQMPVLVGIDVCREARKGMNKNLLFLIIVTARDDAQDIVAGLEAGANDYITKPFDNAELLARVRIGSQMVELQQTLLLRVRELEEAAAHIIQLKGFLPICGYCKKIRDDSNYWQEVEKYIEDNADVRFSHGVCPECGIKHVRPQLVRLGMREEEINRLCPPPNQSIQ